MLAEDVRKRGVRQRQWSREVQVHGACDQVRVQPARKWKPPRTDLKLGFTGRTEVLRDDAVANDMSATEPVSSAGSTLDDAPHEWIRMLCQPRADSTAHARSLWPLLRLESAATHTLIEIPHDV